MRVGVHRQLYPHGRRQPRFIGAAALVAPLAMAALHDGLSTGWMLAFNAASGRLRLLPRSLRSRQGLVLVAAAVIGGPIAMSGYLFGIKYAGPACTVVAGTLRMATSFVVYLCVVLPLVGGLGVFAAAFGQTSFWIVLGAAAAGAASYLTYYAANHLVGASRAMPLNSLYAVWAILFSIVLTGLQPSVQLFAGVLITFDGALLVVSSAPRRDGDLAQTEAIFPPATR